MTNEPCNMDEAQWRERAAVHEAGHALAAYLAGRYPSEVSIEPAAGSLGRVRYAGGPAVDGVEAALTLAGLAAEQLAGGSYAPETASHDLLDYRTIAAALWPTVPAATALAHGLDQVRAYLRSHWGEVEAIRRALLRRGRLGRRGVAWAVWRGRMTAVVARLLAAGRERWRATRRRVGELGRRLARQLGLRPAPAPPWVEAHDRAVRVWHLAHRLHDLKVAAGRARLENDDGRLARIELERERILREIRRLNET